MSFSGSQIICHFPFRGDFLCKKRPHLQRGGTLLLLSFLLLLGIAGWLIGIRPRISTAQPHTEVLLAAAKTSLMAYAVTYGDNYGDRGAGPGHFPCPDIDGDGSPNPPCPLGTLGRLPKRTRVGSRILEFSQEGIYGDEALWYMVSDSYRNNPAGVVNSDTPGRLSVDGNGDVVAVIIASGVPLGNQNRSRNVVTEYLEGENADGDGDFSTTAGNDRVIAIRRADFMPAVERRVAGNMRDLIGEYRRVCGNFPWAAAYGHTRTGVRYEAVPGLIEGLFPATRALPVDWRSGCATKIAPPPWLIANRWPAMSYYAVASAQVQAGGACRSDIDCIKVEELNGEHYESAVVLLAGSPLPGQNRADGSGLDRYFELENSTAGDNSYRTRALTGFNDTLLGVN